MKWLATILCVACLAPASEATLYDSPPLAHDAKSKTQAIPLVHGASLRTAQNVSFSFDSWDEASDSSNDTPSFDLASLAGMTAGSPVTVVGMAWNLDLQVQNFSWFSESVISLGDDLSTPSHFLQPGVGDDFDSPTPMNYSSGGVVNFSSNGLPDLVLADGVVELELYELLDDAADSIDAMYLSGSTLTFDIQMMGVSGDFDGNGDYACADIDALVAEIVAGTNSASFDVTGDGLVNQTDLTAWLAEAGAAENTSGNPYLPGDANLSGVVDFLDFNAWLNNRFTLNAAWCSGDFNASGTIDFLDLNIWLNHRQLVQVVPEPSAFWVGGLGLLACLGRGFRRGEATPR